MRTCVVLIFACAILCAGSASDLTPIPHDIGDIFPTSVSTNMLAVGTFSCHLKTPTGLTIQFMPEDQSNQDKYSLRPYNLLAGCAVDVKITDATDNGVWELVFTPNSGAAGGSRQYNIAVNTATETTTEHSDRNVEYLNELFFNTSLGEKEQIKISYFDFVTTESCHLETPKGDVYDLNDLNIKGVEVIKHSEVACGVEVNVAEDLVGKWTLISKDTRLGSPIERRLNFTIYIEEVIRASPEEITIAAGNNLHVRLAKPTILHDTCKLVAPSENNGLTYVKDENYKDECGFIVLNVQKSYSGKYEIVYGKDVIYKAPIQVTVNDALEKEEIKLNFVRDRPVDEHVGPADATYCRIVDPNEHVIFEGFARCRITLDRARSQHNGIWYMVVGVPGRLITKNINVTVTISEAEQRPRVITRVEKQRPEVLLTCALEGSHTISSCKFREPSGRVLLASQGIGEDRYSSHGAEVQLHSSVTTTECGLRITDPTFEDMGLWRCAVETSDDVYYGFLTVICPFATTQPGAPAIVTDPILAASHSLVLGVEQEAVTMSCSVQSAIRYCYFRARNGTTFSVSPGTQSELFEYVGAGFDAGECGVRFSSLEARDTGAWSCHVGLDDRSVPEQRASFSVNIQRPILADQMEVTGGLAITGNVYEGRAVEYCRFVRIDGLGFTTDNLPDGYQDVSSLAYGLCGIVVTHPTMLDHHPWTVAARVVGQQDEVSATTAYTIVTTPAPEHVEPVPEPAMNRGHSWTWAWLLILLLSLSIALLALNMVAGRHRQWVAEKATTLRNSFRKKKPLEEPLPPYTETANAA